MRLTVRVYLSVVRATECFLTLVENYFSFAKDVHVVETDCAQEKGITLFSLRSQIQFLDTREGTQHDRRRFAAFF
jgi:hypothetical protein